MSSNLRQCIEMNWWRPVALHYFRTFDCNCRWEHKKNWWSVNCYGNQFSLDNLIRRATIIVQTFRCYMSLQWNESYHDVIYNNDGSTHTHTYISEKNSFLAVCILLILPLRTAKCSHEAIEGELLVEKWKMG